MTGMFCKVYAKCSQIDLPLKKLNVMCIIDLSFFAVLHQM